MFSCDSGLLSKFSKYQPTYFNLNDFTMPRNLWILVGVSLTVMAVYKYIGFVKKYSRLI